MDCRNFKEMLDSYLCDELSVETNHACLQHAERCSSCRAELGARRELRRTLRTACHKTVLSEAAQVRLRACLQAEGAPATARGWWPKLSWWNWSALLTWPVAAPLAVVFLASLGWFGWRTLQRSGVTVQVPDLLSETVLAEAAGDHRTCAAHFADGEVAEEVATTPDWMKKQYPAYAQLVEVAAPGARGLQLKSVHVCRFENRQFGHLVYAQPTAPQAGEPAKMVSLLVTPRDGACLRAGQVPTDDGSAAGLQRGRSAACQINAYQTAKYVVLVVSDFPEADNQQLAERLAAPVSTHLRQIEKTLTWLSPFTFETWLAGFRDQWLHTQIDRQIEGGRTI